MGIYVVAKTCDLFTDEHSELGSNVHCIYNLIINLLYEVKISISHVSLPKNPTWLHLHFGIVQFNLSSSAGVLVEIIGSMVKVIVTYYTKDWPIDSRRML